MLGGVPAASARATSSALAARITSAESRRACAIACSAASFTARVAVASTWLADRARTAASWTASSSLTQTSVGRSSPRLDRPDAGWTRQPLWAWIFSVAAGSTECRSPTTPKSTSSKIGASGSLLTATIVLEVCMPARCWIAPEMPLAT